MTSDLKDLIIGVIPALLTLNVLLIIGYVVINHENLALGDNVHKIGSNELMYILPVFFLINFLLIVILFAVNYRSIIGSMKGVKKNTIILLVVILLIGFYLREFVVPHTHRIFFDEDLYIGIGNSIATEGRAIMCNYGSPTHCTEGILNKDPSAYPFLVAVVFKLIGSGEWSIFHLMAVVSTLSILLVFMVVYALLRNEKAALYASLLMALTPAHIVWSGSVATEIVFTFLSLLTVLAFLIYFRNKTLKMHLFGAVSLAYTVQIRPEGLIFAATILAGFLLFERDWWQKLTDYRFYMPWIIFFLLIVPHATQMYMNRGGTWGAPGGKKISLDYFPHHFSENTLFWFDGMMHPAMFTLFSLIGFMYMFRENMRALLFNALWFLPLFILFTLFYAGNVTSGGIGFRFVNLYCVPVLILGGYGLYKLHEIIEENIEFEVVAPLVLTATVFVSFLFYSTFPFNVLVDGVAIIHPQIRNELTHYQKPPADYLLLPSPANPTVNLTFSNTTAFLTEPGQPAQYARDMHDKLVMPNMDRINSSCYVLTHNPSIFLAEGKNSLQTWYGSNKPVMDKVFSETDCVMWLEGAWCAVSKPHKEGACKSMHDNYDLEVFAQYVRPKNPEHVFTLYNVYRKE